MREPRIQWFMSFLCFPEAPLFIFSESEGEEDSPLVSVSGPHAIGVRTPKLDSLVSGSTESHGAEPLDLELKHVRLLFGQLGHFLSDGFHKGCGGDVGQGSIGWVIFRQALL